MKSLEVIDLSFNYVANTPFLSEISFSLEQGDIFCLLGPNGSGKTTLVSQILFPNKKNRKKIKLFGKYVSEMPLSDRAKLLGYVPQKIPFPHISVIQAIIMGRYPYKKIFFNPTEDDYTVAEWAMEQMGLKRYMNMQLNTLSGGEIQRVFIAQSLAKQAKIYLFDEPMSALDPEYQADFLRLLTWLSKNGSSVIFTTHNPNHLYSLENVRAAVMDRTHLFSEIEANTAAGVKKIEDVFNGKMSIKYSEQQKRYVATFVY